MSPDLSPKPKSHPYKTNVATWLLILTIVYEETYSYALVLQCGLRQCPGDKGTVR